MRTSRVVRSQSSVFRNSRQYLHSNEQVFRVLQEGEFSQFAGKQGSEKRKKHPDKKPASRKVILKTNSKMIAVSGLRYDAMSIATLQNHLLKYSAKIDLARNKVIRIRAYRSSI